MNCGKPVNPAQMIFYFAGQYHYAKDHKGRINIPSKFRKALTPQAEDTLFVTRGLDKYLSAYPLDTWNQLMNSVDQLPLDLERKSVLQRMLSAHGTYTTFDNQGRIAIPSHLWEFAEISDEVLIIGVGNWIEIWNPSLFEKHVKDVESLFAETFRSITMSFRKSG